MSLSSNIYFLILGTFKLQNKDHILIKFQKLNFMNYNKLCCLLKWIKSGSCQLSFLKVKDSNNCLIVQNIKFWRTNLCNLINYCSILRSIVKITSSNTKINRNESQILFFTFVSFLLRKLIVRYICSRFFTFLILYMVT